MMYEFVNTVERNQSKPRSPGNSRIRGNAEMTYCQPISLAQTCGTWFRSRVTQTQPARSHRLLSRTSTRSSRAVPARLRSSDGTRLAEAPTSLAAHHRRIHSMPSQVSQARCTRRVRWRRAASVPALPPYALQHSAWAMAAVSLHSRRMLVFHRVSGRRRRPRLEAWQSCRLGSF